MSKLLIFIFLVSASNSALADNRISPFAKNVVRHVLIHELAHALIREFDLPVLGNEENIADSFATLFIAQTMPETAEDIIHDRARSWMLEASEGEPGQYNFLSEHSPDAMRAYQAICLLYGSDPWRYSNLPTWGTFTDKDLQNCADFAPEIARSWRRVINQFKMPDDMLSGEFRIIYGEGPMKQEMMNSGLLEEIGGIVGQFDWHSRITLHFDHCDSGASWNRSRRTILLCDNYVSRFIEQGQ